MIELIGNLRRPETSSVAIEDVALDGLAKSGGAAVMIGCPSGREYQRTAQRDVRTLRRLLRRTLQRHDIVLLRGHLARDSLGLAIN